MSQPLTVDPAVLAREAANLERIGAELRAVFNRVQAIAVELLPQFRGQAGAAVQAALARFQQAAIALMQVHDDIRTKVHTAGIRYSATDDEQSGRVGQAMHHDSKEHDGKHGDVWPVDDHKFKEAPGQPFPQKPWDYDLDLKSRVTAHEPGAPGPPVSAGSVTRIDEVWNELHRCFNCNFPIGGAPKEFPKVGDQLPLEVKTYGLKALNLPVQVTQIERTGKEINIEFATLPGHADGVGSTIHFRFVEEAGEMHLRIAGHLGPDAPGSEGQWYSPGARAGYGGLIAPATWQPYIDNLTRHVAQGKHMPTWDRP
jgi:WXG100 family type VII secretion target